MKLRMEEKATGIDVEPNTELDNLLEEILEKEKFYREQADAVCNENKKRAENDRQTAEDMRKTAFERMGQTSKRKSEEEGEGSKGKKPRNRRNTSEAFEYLKEKASYDRELKEQEIALQKKQQQASEQIEKARIEHQENVMTALANQQQQQQQVMMSILAQQQQQSQALLSFMEKFLAK